MNNSEEKAPPDKSEREEMLPEQFELARAMTALYLEAPSAVVDDIKRIVKAAIRSEVIRALKDAAKLVCDESDCNQGWHRTMLQDHALYKCAAARIFAQIAALESPKAEK